MMQRFKKRPMDVEAERWLEGELPPALLVHDEIEGIHYLPTASGRWKANPGDWVVRGASGNLYVVPHDDFLKIYEPVEN